VLCNEAPNAAHWTADLIARGFVAKTTVATTAGGVSPNPLEAADVSNGGNSATPDLSLVIFAPASDSTSPDAVAYIYDEAISATVVAGKHFIYKSDGSETAVGSCLRSSENNATVICFGANGTLAGSTYVGGNVRSGAVTDVDGGGSNSADEVGVSPSSQAAGQTADRTDGPDLTDVTINQVTSPFGTVSYTATFTFDEDTAATANTSLTATDNAAGGNSSTGDNVIAQLLHLYTSDGIRLDCNTLASSALTTGDATLAARGEDHDNTVTCYGFIVGTAGPTATATQIHSAVVGTVDYGAVDDEAAASGDANPEGAALTTGGNGTPQS